VEGDSASSTELYALLSNLANLPVRQGIAVTGSVNQKGQVQAIGGVNEKIEGYYELCKLLGLNGEQGVIIPSSNMRNLMLKEEVAEAVSSGKFHVWSVDNIDEGIELLTGVRAGNIADEGSVNYLVARTLDEYAKKMLENGEMEPDGKMNNMGKWVSDIV
jgi:predicted ATP-dependent protease